MDNAFKKEKNTPFVKLSILALCGALAGVLNGFLGSGGGIILVFAMTYLCKDMDTKDTFSTAVASVLPLSVFSALIYYKNGVLPTKDIWRFLIPGAFGGIFGSFIMDKLSPKVLKVIFAALMVFAGTRMIMR